MTSPTDAIELSVVPPAEVESTLISPDLGMLILTWIVFVLLLAVLYKFAWKPILAALDARENAIRKSIEDVERIAKEMASIEASRKQLLDDAQIKSKEILDTARHAAKKAAQIIEIGARERAKISLENALRDIREETQKARITLREESAQIAVELAGKILEENMNTSQNQKIVNRIINEI